MSAGLSDDRHAYLVSRGYSVREVRGSWYAYQNGERVSGACEHRGCAWAAADEHSYWGR
jgi:hypothetical protein